ncbi:MAG TPA: hypothetical protein VK783_13895 [Bacteroidia bacterium]|nr:hypothetical protein [Bacteroidia bacterium]
MKCILKLVLFLICFGLLASCSNNARQQNNSDFTISPDSLFVLKNLKTSLFKVDSATYKKFAIITKAQKLKFVTPSIFDENPQVSSVKQSYINDFVSCHFIAEQDSVGSFKPIIISASGDDYHALFLLLLGKNNKLAAHILLSGGLEGGPDGETGDFILLHQRESILNNDEVLTYVLNIKQYEKDSTKRAQVDSISYLRKISPDGTIKVVKKDSSRYFRKINWPNHYW